MSGMLCEELVTVLGAARAARPSADVSPPYVGLDEDVNYPALSAVVGDLLARGRIAGSSPLWNKKLIHDEDGSSFYVLGGKTKGVSVPEFHDAHDAKGETWPDERVLSLLIAHFLSHDRLILLSKNKALDPGGLRWLLRNVIKPVLSAQHSNRFSLTTLFMGGKTKWDRYGERVTQFIEAGCFEPGCWEEVVVRGSNG